MRTNKHRVDVVFALALFCAFAASILMVLITGANVYRDVAATMEGNYEERTCLSYIGAKLRHFDSEGGVSVGRLGDTTALLLSERIDGAEFVTYIYYDDGYAKELFTEMGAELPPEAGLNIIPARSLEFEEVAEGLIRARCEGKSGNSADIYLAPRGD
ncbi:MAG: DUF4860 domain-containing protein [Peptococcaceae bacterium]|jgi:hypothetical protein|nr:DUF4860 domain-containing protein [Peptococcaceae bacterium]